MAVLSSISTSVPVQVAAVLSRPLEVGDMVISSSSTSTNIPRAALLSRPLEDAEMATASSSSKVQCAGNDHTSMTAVFVCSKLLIILHILNAHRERLD